MTPDDEARFIALWQQSLETTAIAPALGILRGTAASRAYMLVRYPVLPQFSAPHNPGGLSHPLL